MITFERPRKFWLGKKRVACKAAPKLWQQRLSWGLSFKINDYIGTCEGCNRKIIKIEYVWSNYGDSTNSGKGNHNYWISDIVYTVSGGMKHYLKGSNCVRENYSISEIVKYFSSIDNRNNIQLIKDQIELIQVALKNKMQITDQFGELLPEYEAKI